MCTTELLTFCKEQAQLPLKLQRAPWCGVCAAGAPDAAGRARLGAVAACALFLLAAWHVVWQPQTLRRRVVFGSVKGSWYQWVSADLSKTQSAFWILALLFSVTSIRNFLLNRRNLPLSSEVCPHLPQCSRRARWWHCCSEFAGALGQGSQKGSVPDSTGAGLAHYCCICCWRSTPLVSGVILSRHYQCLPVRLLGPAITLNNRTGRKKRPLCYLCWHTHVCRRAASPAALTGALAGPTFVVGRLGRRSVCAQLGQGEPVEHFCLCWGLPRFKAPFTA